jgi:hypothetical protein
MADRTTTKIIETRPSSGRDAFPIADGVTVAAGTLIGIEGGHANHWADGANDVFAGICIGGDDRSGDGILIGETSDDPDPQCHVDTSGVTLMHLDSIGDTPLQSEVGDLVYCVDSDTDSMTLLASGRTHPIGWMVRFRSATDVDVRLFTPSEMLCQATA